MGLRDILTLRTNDDAGRGVRIFDGPGFRSWQTSQDPRIRDLVRRIGFVMMDKGQRRSLDDTLLRLAPMILVAGAVALHTTYRFAPLWIMMSAVVVGSIPAAHLLVRRSVARRAAILTRLMLEEGLCPSCGYNFHGLERDAEILACPECGAAWRSDRVLRTAAIDERGTLGAALRHGAELVQTGYDDDRGTRVGMADPRLRRARRDARGVEAPRTAALNAARADLARIGRVRRIVAASAVFASGLGLAGVLLSLKAGPAGASMPWIIMVSPLVICASGVGVYFGKYAYTPARVRSTLLAHRMCASCAEPLGHLAPDPHDACVVCETCRAAWRLE